jgi:hypothetical protein
LQRLPLGRAEIARAMNIFGDRQVDVARIRVEVLAIVRNGCRKVDGRRSGAQRIVAVRGIDERGSCSMTDAVPSGSTEWRSLTMSSSSSSSGPPPPRTNSVILPGC